MPIAHEFAPQLVIIAAGFDAGAGDPLGGCDVTPRGFAQLAAMLKTLAGGRLVVCLEGGYNLDTVATSTEAVARVLLGADPPVAPPLIAQEAAEEAICAALAVHSKCARRAERRAPSAERRAARVQPDSAVLMRAPSAARAVRCRHWQCLAYARALEPAAQVRDAPPLDGRVAGARLPGGEGAAGERERDGGGADDECAARSKGGARERTDGRAGARGAHGGSNGVTTSKRRQLLAVRLLARRRRALRRRLSRLYLHATTPRAWRSGVAWL